jgi:hypothetical protein
MHLSKSGNLSKRDEPTVQEGDPQSTVQEDLQIQVDPTFQEDPIIQVEDGDGTVKITFILNL